MKCLGHLGYEYPPLLDWLVADLGMNRFICEFTNVSKRYSKETSLFRSGEIG